MKTKKNYQISLFILLMLLVNYLGKNAAETLNLPIWMDSLGTVLTAYIFDPFCGAVVGLTTNLIYGFHNQVSIIYGLTNIAIAVIAGYCARKGWFETLFGTLTTSVLVTLASVVISTPLNAIFNEGMTGNLWGDSIISYLREQGFANIFCIFAGEFYIDFLDKVVTLVILYLIVKVIRFHNDKKNNTIVTSTVLLIMTLSLLAGTDVNAATKENLGLNEYIQTVYNSDNGLPCGEANDVAQTNDGILWVGTYAGLYRYNGSEFRWMDDFDSVRNVNCLYVDEEGRLWIGTNDNGLSIYINEEIVNVVDEEKGLPSNSVRSIVKCSDGNYYVGTSSSLQIMTLTGGLDMIDVIPEIVYGHTISADDNGYIAVVTNEGYLYLVKGKEVLGKWKPEAEQEIFTCCSFDEEGFLYAGTSGNNIYRYGVSTDKLVKKSIMNTGELSNINEIFFDSDDTLFVCSDTGIGYFTGSGKASKVNTNTFNNSIDSMAIDYQGNLWFASSRLGMLKLSESSFTDICRASGVEGNVVNAVTKWQDRLYIGTDSGLEIVDESLSLGIEDELTEQLKDVRIRCLMTDSNDHLWICTYGKGLLEVAPNGTVTAYDSTNGQSGDWVRVVKELSDGQIIGASDTGVTYYNYHKVGKSLKFNSDLGSAMILCLEEMTDGRIFCGTDGDGIFIIKDGEVTDRLTREDGLSSGVILRIVEDIETGGAFIITSNGLCYMDSYGSISFMDNFPYYNNYDLWEVDNGTVFVLGSAGIYVADREKMLSGKKEFDFELLDSKRGLSAALTANSWNYLDDNGDFYLSCDSGVYRMNVYNYNTSKKSYRMMVSSVRLDNVTYGVERGEDIRIGRGVSKIEIFPEVINYTVEDPNVSYYLEGFDNEPVIISQSELSSIVYTNLPSGTYKFHLRVLDDKRENILEESVYEIVKENEFYDTQAFRIYMFVVAMLAVAWFTWFIARTQIQRTINFQRKELEFAKDQLRMGNETILAIAKTVDAKDENTSQHSQRVSEYSVLIARELGFSEDECENLRKAALLHDIGKIGIRDAVLNKPGRLSDSEYAEMKSHVTKGAEILKDFTLVDHVIDGALYHHERYDGTGYPKGLSGEDIPLYGRIIGVADAFDAMTANRVYRKQLDFDFVLKELKRCRGTQFDPVMLDILLKLIDDGKINVEALYNKSSNSDMKDFIEASSPENESDNRKPKKNKKGNKDRKDNKGNKDKKESKENKDQEGDD